MLTESTQPNDNLGNNPKEGTTRSRYTRGRFTNLQNHAKAIGIKTSEISKREFLKDPAGYFAELSVLVNEKLDRVPDEVIRRTQERSLKPDELRRIVKRYYGLDGESPAINYGELNTKLSPSRNRDLVQAVLSHSRDYLRRNPSPKRTGNESTKPASNPDWKKLGDLEEHYN